MKGGDRVRGMVAHEIAHPLAGLHIRWGRGTIARVTTWRSRCPTTLVAGLLFAVSCTPTPPAPPATTTRIRVAPAVSTPRVSTLHAPPGDVFLVVAGVGIVRLEGDRFVPIVRADDIVDIALSPAGTLYASAYDLGTVRVVDGNVEQLSKTAYRRFVFRSDNDVWATPDPFDWALHHFDGHAWSVVRTREAFDGKFDDNKLNDFAVTESAVWVSSWNGLFRQSDDTWERIGLPSGAKPPWRLVVLRDHLVGRFFEGYFQWGGDGWTKLSWPSDASIARVSPSGLGVGHMGSGSARVLVGELGVEGRPHAIMSGGAGDIQDLDVDANGRVWIAGDHALAVFDSDGAMVRAFPPGTLDGVSGRLERVAVAAGGPRRLPAKLSPVAWELHGVVALYRSGKPLPHTTVQICASRLNCSNAPWRLTTTTAADGTFRFRGVPTGEFQIHVTVPAGLDDCQAPFTETPSTTIAIATECAETSEHRCDVPKIDACWPFEMPPPP